jgi:hypothetical protein
MKFAGASCDSLRKRFRGIKVCISRVSGIASNRHFGGGVTDRFFFSYFLVGEISHARAAGARR